jgi:hypothetical protein
VLKNQSAISPQLSSLATSCINKPFQHLHVKSLINSGPLGYKFEVDDTPMSKKQINIILNLDFEIRGLFGLEIHYKLFLKPQMFPLAISAV